MNQKVLCMMFVCVLGLTGVINASPDWTNGTGNHLWRDAGNWWPGNIPSGSDWPRNYQDVSQYMLIDELTVASCAGLTIAAEPSVSVGSRLDMTGGYFNAGQLILVGQNNYGEFNLSGGYATASTLWIGGSAANNVATGTVNVSGEGYLDVGNLTICNSSLPDSMVLNISGGVVEADAMWIPTVTNTLKINITGDGALIVNGDITSGFQWMQNNGMLNAGATWDFGVTHAGQTTVVPEPASMILFAMALGGILRHRKSH
jgi:hypothetical protein